jgi:hypothetical protein
VDVNLPGEVECQANSITSDAGNAHNTNWVARITNHHLFTLAPCNHEHALDLLSVTRADAWPPPK